MTLTNRAAIYRNGSWLALAPFGPLRVSEKKLSEAIEYQIPLGGIEIYERHRGWEIEIEGLYVESSPLAGLVYQDALDSIVRSSRLAANCDVQLWEDTTDTVRRVYRNCKVIDGPYFTPDTSNSAAAMRYNLVLRTGDPVRYATASNGQNAPASAFENYLINGGEDDDMNVTIIQNKLVRSVIWSGTIEGPTDANSLETQFALLPSADDIMTVTGIKVIGAKLWGAAGTTTIVVSDAPYNSDGTTISIALAHNARTSAITAGEIVIAAGDPLYAYIGGSGSGRHSDLQLEIHMENA